MIAETDERLKKPIDTAEQCLQSDIVCMVDGGIASCCNKYFGSNYYSALPTSLLIALDLRTEDAGVYIAPS
jgi:hypothetical protein